MTTFSLHLASTSPRRRLLLIEHGYEHVVIAPGLDDAGLRIPAEAPPHHWTAALAYLKARSALSRLPAGDEAPRIILAADTIVVKNQAVLGQPMTEEHATRIIRSLRGGSHVVMTGVALLTPTRRVLFTDQARVTIGDLTDERIESYISSGLWRGKAGAYNLAERLDEGWPITYEGDPATIMGLPINRLKPILERLLRNGSEERA